jgi:hypothetical protein
MLIAMAVVGVVGYIMEYSLVGRKLNYNNHSDNIMMVMMMMAMTHHEVEL